MCVWNHHLIMEPQSKLIPNAENCESCNRKNPQLPLLKFKSSSEMWHTQTAISI